MHAAPMCPRRPWDRSNCCGSIHSHVTVQHDMYRRAGVHYHLCCHVCKHWLLAHARDTSPYSAIIGYLREREDGNLVLGIIGQVLVEIGQAGRIPAELVIHHPQLVSSRHLPATLQNNPCQARISLIWALPTLRERESNLCPSKALGHLRVACCQPAG